MLSHYPSALPSQQDVFDVMAVEVEVARGAREEYSQTQSVLTCLSTLFLIHIYVRLCARSRASFYNLCMRGPPGEE